MGVGNCSNPSIGHPSPGDGLPHLNPKTDRILATSDTGMSQRGVVGDRPQNGHNGMGPHELMDCPARAPTG